MYQGPANRLIRYRQKLYQVPTKSRLISYRQKLYQDQPIIDLSDIDRNCTRDLPIDLLDIDRNYIRDLPKDLLDIETVPGTFQ